MTSSPSNGRVPVSISNSTHPNDQMSTRLSTGRPRACSGAMYAAVPTMTPMPVIAGVDSVGESDIAPSRLVKLGSDASLARPKSSTFTAPSGRTLMLAGFRSR